jgi:hypothetical protein
MPSAVRTLVLGGVPAVTRVLVLVGQQAYGVAQFVGTDQVRAVVVGGHRGDSGVPGGRLDAAVTGTAVLCGIRDDEDDVGVRGLLRVRVDLLLVDAEQPLDVVAEEVTTERGVLDDVLGGVSGDTRFVRDRVDEPEVEEALVALVRLDREDRIELGLGVLPEVLLLVRRVAVAHDHEVEATLGGARLLQRGDLAVRGGRRGRALLLADLCRYGWGDLDVPALSVRVGEVLDRTGPRVGPARGFGGVGVTGEARATEGGGREYTGEERGGQRTARGLGYRHEDLGYSSRRHKCWVNQT